MRFIVLAMLVGCVLANSLERVRRDANDEESTESPPACSVTTWANGIVCYSFDSSVDGTLEELYLSVFARYMEVSCIQFISADDSACEAVDALAVEVVEQEAGCWAHVGCSTTQQTRISMASNCYSFGVILHEVFHTLGRFHEQSRQDRDDHVTVHMDNVITSKQGNYAKCTRELYDIPYDYQSIMHYSDRHFLISGRNATMTINVEEDKYNQKLMGLQGKLSFSDIVTANKMYGCYSAAGITDYHCEHGGVKTASGTCVCHQPFTGDNCENVLDTAQHFELGDGTTEEINSAGFPGTYSSNQNTYVVLECNSPKHVSVNFETFDIEAYGCGYDFIQNYLSGEDTYGLKECGNSLGGQSIQSRENFMVLFLHTDDLYEYQGFEASVSCVD